MALIFSKYFYVASMTSYYTFYLIDRFHTSVQTTQVFLFSVALGTVLGGLLRDRYGRNQR